MTSDPVDDHPPARRGRRPGPSGTRQAILDAARARFAREGYTAATIRGIAADAGVNAALVMQFFRSKDELFAAVMSITPATLHRIADAFGGPHQGVGERVVRAYLDVWEGSPQDAEPLLAMLRSAISSEQAAGQLRDFIEARVRRGTESTDRHDPQVGLRVALVSAMLVGVVVARRVVTVPTLAAADRDTIVGLVAPGIQAVLTPAEPAAHGRTT
ncbi:TetR family transcriptional regulator [Actinokineospora sp. PR83]|uniref:TetR/AcrR family transcriptional regulator n=1 Tax=Actinokineospora sp. PR83 TaxID=2884908 RepID=UPI001F44104D|nr:TetR/AcrR family transcriptional regulator [Actinokineospora sp. PR83]MCG8914485.1 TetR family transcriptional regulator [Actinokineospora sp. PR83]